MFEDICLTLVLLDEVHTNLLMLLCVRKLFLYYLVILSFSVFYIVVTNNDNNNNALHSLENQYNDYTILFRNCRYIVI